MSALRRVYLYLAAAISLQATAWAAISLLRQIGQPQFVPNPQAFSEPLAVLLMALAIYVVHHVAIGRLLGESVDERRSVIRQLYLYGMSAGFLAPWLPNAVSLLSAGVAAITGMSTDQGLGMAALGPVMRSTVPALFVLGLLWVYHLMVLRADAVVERLTTDGAALRRLYRLGFAFAGWQMALYSAIHVLRWIMLQLPMGSAMGVAAPHDLPRELARLAVGAGLWAVFWRAAEQQRATGEADELRSALRYVYLYGIIGVAVVATVVNGGLILTGALRRLLELPPMGDLRGPLPVVIVMGIVWALYGRLIAREVSGAVTTPIQASVRRIYAYLIAAAGLTSFLIGTSIFLSAVLAALTGSTWSTADKEKLAWSAAAMLMGLAVWAPAWRAAQVEATVLTPEGAQERAAFSRKLYAYAALFATVMMTMGGGIEVLRKVIETLLGGADQAADRIEWLQSLAVLAVGAAGWAYHALVLRTDGRLDAEWKQGREAELGTLVLDGGDGSFGHELVDRLRHELPSLAVTAVGLTPDAATAMGAAGAELDVLDAIGRADLIVASWEISRPGGLDGAVSDDLARAVQASAAQKLLVPSAPARTVWAGVDPLTPGGLVEQTVHAVRQLVAGEPVHAVRPALTPNAVVTGFFVMVLIMLGWILLVSGVQMMGVG